MRRISKSGLAIVSMGMFLAAGCADVKESAEPAAPADGAIRFSARTEFTRGGDITTNNLSSFNVYAYTGSGEKPAVFMDNVTVSKTGSNTWTYSPIQYWPAGETVDFYAFSPASWVGEQNPLMPVSYDASEATEDIVYAVSPDMTGHTGMPNAQVVFNFRHALSKLTMKLSSTNTKLKVVVTHVALTNIMTKGNFTFPSGSTSDKASEGTVGKWTDQNTPMTYMMLWSQALSDQLTLTPTPTVIAPEGLSRGGVMYALPQPLTYRSNGRGKDNFVAVQCSVYDAETGVRLWPNENTPEENLINGSTTGDGVLRFPLSTSKFTEWMPGCHYIYNLVINSNEDMGAIEFGNPTVDTFIEVESNYE